MSRYSFMKFFVSASLIQCRIVFSTGKIAIVANHIWITFARFCCNPERIGRDSPLLVVKIGVIN